MAGTAVEVMTDVIDIKEIFARIEPQEASKHMKSGFVKSIGE